MLYCEVIGQVWTRINLERKKKLFLTSLGQVLNYFFAAGISCSICAPPGWWTRLFLSCLSPRLMPCPFPGVHSPPWHLFTWKRPPRDWCLTFTSTLHLPPPPDYNLPRQSNHANLMAGWRRVEVAPEPPPLNHERLDYCTLTSLSATYTRSVPICSGVSLCSFARWSCCFATLHRFCSSYSHFSVHPKGL
jgi:hypothetical protein